MFLVLLAITLAILIWRIMPRTPKFPHLENARLNPMPVCVGDPEAPSTVFVCLYHEFKSWTNVGPNECSVYVLVPTEEGFFHPEDVEEARRLKTFNPEIRLVKFVREECRLRGVTLLEIEANVGVA